MWFFFLHILFLVFFYISSSFALFSLLKLFSPIYLFSFSLPMFPLPPIYPLVFHPFWYYMIMSLFHPCYYSPVCIRSSSHCFTFLCILLFVLLSFSYLFLRPIFSTCLKFLSKSACPPYWSHHYLSLLHFFFFIHAHFEQIQFLPSITYCLKLHIFALPSPSLTRSKMLDMLWVSATP